MVYDNAKFQFYSSEFQSYSTGIQWNDWISIGIFGALINTGKLGCRGLENGVVIR